MKKTIFIFLLISISSAAFAQFYTEKPVCEFTVDFTNIGVGVLTYYGYRPSKEEVVNLDIDLYIKHHINSFETYIPNSWKIHEKNTSLNVLVINAMRKNKITFCKTRYANRDGGFTYIFNVSFDNYKTFDTVAFDVISIKSALLIRNIELKNVINFEGSEILFGFISQGCIK